MLIPRSRQNPFKSSMHRDQFPATNQLCTAIHVILKIIPAMTAKNAPYPPRHRDYFAAKETGCWPMASSGNAYLLYCRAVMVKHSHEFKFEPDS